MGKYDLGVIMYSFDNANRALDRVNPSLKIKVTEDESIWMSRYSCTSCWGIDLNRTPYITFDENLQFAEFDKYLVDAKEYKHIPYLGFYIDIPNSNNYFERRDIPTERVKTKEMMNADREYLTAKRISMEPDQSADEAINYVKQKIGA